MKRVLTVAAVVLVALALVATPALAAGKGAPAAPPRQRMNAPTFALVGEVISFDGQVLTVTVYEGNWQVLDYIASGDPLSVTLDEAVTRMREYGATPGVVVPPKDWAKNLTEGTLVSVRGTVTDGAFAATGVTVDVPYQG